MREITSIVVGAPGCCDTFTVGKGGLERVHFDSDEGERYANLYWADGTMTTEFHIVTVRYGKMARFVERGASE